MHVDGDAPTATGAAKRARAASNTPPSSSAGTPPASGQNSPAASAHASPRLVAPGGPTPRGTRSQTVADACVELQALSMQEPYASALLRRHKTLETRGTRRPAKGAGWPSEWASMSGLAHAPSRRASDSRLAGAHHGAARWRGSWAALVHSDMYMQHMLYMCAILLSHVLAHAHVHVTTNTQREREQESGRGGGSL